MNATSVFMNVTVTDTTGAGLITVYPAGSNRPNASNLNYSAGQTIPNLVIVPLGTGGSVRFYNQGGTVQLIADVTGYVAAPGAPTSITTTTPVPGSNDVYLHSYGGTATPPIGLLEHASDYSPTHLYDVLMPSGHLSTEYFDHVDAIYVSSYYYLVNGTTGNATDTPELITVAPFEFDASTFGHGWTQHHVDIMTSDHPFL